MESAPRFVLKKPVTVADPRTGTTRDAQFVELREPTGKMAFAIAPIRQGLTRAIMEHQQRVRGDADDDEPELPAQPDTEEPAPEEPEVPDPEAEPDVDPVTMLYIVSTSSVDLGPFYGHVRAMLLQPRVAMVDGEIPLTGAIFDALSLRDAELLMAAFCSRFIGAS